MQSLLRNSSLIFCLVSLVYVTPSKAQSETWQPAMDGMLSNYQIPSAFSIQFKPEGPMGRDWIHGFWLDQDSVFRLAGYREGGRWKSLPIYAQHGTFGNSSHVIDMVMYGDTLYMGGLFTEVFREKDSTEIPLTTILKMHNDSIWSDQILISLIRDMDASGDSLLVWGGVYVRPSDTLGGHMLATQGATVWQEAFGIPHPTDSLVDFGADTKCVIRNGEIITLNNGSSGAYGGITRWDGQQWHSYGDGVRGTYSNAYDFEFYRNELYLAGSFTRQESPLNPGEFIARWDGQQWHEVGGGLNTAANDIWVYNDKLYCEINGELFGDAPIPAFAAWDGQQWCGTPINYSLQNDPLLSHHNLEFGIIKDTLYMTCQCFVLPSANGQPLSYINYFDGDYLNGPNAICSTPGLGREENQLSEKTLKVFPVPARDEVNVSMENMIEELKVFDLSGSCILELRPESREANLDVSSWSPGVYLLQVNGQYNRKMVKE